MRRRGRYALAGVLGIEHSGIVGSAHKGDWAIRFGANHLVVAQDDEWAPEVRKVVGSEGVALAVDGNDGAGGLRNIDVLATLGTAVFIGASSGAQVPEIAPRLLIPKAQRIAGFACRS